MDGLFKLLGNEAAGGGSDIKEMRKAIGKLMMITQAMWEIIAESHSLSDDHIVAKVREIDLRDGAVDGKIKKPIRVCVSCGKVLPLGRDGCLYCGSLNKGADLFHTVSIDTGDYLGQTIF